MLLFSKKKVWGGKVGTTLNVPFAVEAVTRRTPSLYPVLTGFGVSSFGSASVTISSPLSPGLLLFLLSDSQYERAHLLSQPAFVDNKVALCAAPAALRLGAGRSFAETSLFHGRYGLYLVNCLRSDEVAGTEAGLWGFSGAATLSCVGNALPGQDRPLFVVYGLQLVVLLVLSAWCLRTFRTRTTLHGFVLLAVLLRVLETVVRLAVLGVISDRGGREPMAASSAAAVIKGLAASVLFAVFFLAGSGWKISPRPLDPGKLRLFVFYVVTYLASLLAGVLLCSNSVTSLKIRKDMEYCSFPAIAQVIIRLGLSFSVLSTLNPTILIVRAWARERENDPSTWTVAARFIWSAARIRRITLAFAFFPALLLFADAMLVQWEQSWMLIALAAIADSSILILTARL
jgi:hypothetical protein